MDLENPSATDEAHAVDASFVAAPDPEVEIVEVDSEALLYRPDGMIRAAVNSGAALIWTCLDGTSTLGEIASDLAEGFGVPFEVMLADVVAAVDDFVARGMAYDAHGQRTTSPDAGRTFARPLPASDFPLGDDGIVTVQIGAEVVGVRSNDPDVFSLLRDALAPIAVDDVEATRRLSLLVTPDRGRIAGLCFLYRDDELVFRSASRGRATRATFAHLDHFLPAAEGTIQLDAHVLVGRKGAVLVGGESLEMLELAGRHLGSVGWHVVDRPGAVVDRADCSAVVDAPRIQLDPAGLAAIQTRYPPESDEVTRSGRHEITTVVVVGHEPYPARPASPAQRLAVLLPLVARVGSRVHHADVEWLSRLAARIGDLRWLHSTDDQELLGVLASLAGRTPRPTMPLRR